MFFLIACRVSLPSVLSGCYRYSISDLAKKGTQSFLSPEMTS